jgi:hypothetical protein
MTGHYQICQICQIYQVQWTLSDVDRRGVHISRRCSAALLYGTSFCLFAIGYDSIRIHTTFLFKDWVERGGASLRL